MKEVIVVFGGAFNPPTNAHFALAEQIHTTYKEVEKILFVPVADGYPKKDLLHSQHRVEMLKKVCAHNPYFDVSTIEVDATQVLDSIETLAALQSIYPHRELWFTMGTDNLKLMPTWPCYKKFIEHFKCVVLERHKDDFETILSSHPLLRNYKNRFIKLTENIRSDCSSTLLRHYIRQGKSIRYMVPDEVYFYIREKGLYTIVETSSL